MDDSPSILRVVETVLSGAGYDVESAADGGTALDLARAQVPDLMLLDFMMPRMNGYQVCKAMREDDRLRDIPVVLMCTKGDGAAERFVQQMGVVDYITKPFSPDAILALTSYTLEKHGGQASTAMDVPQAQPSSRHVDIFAEEQTLVQAIRLDALSGGGETTSLNSTPPPQEAPEQPSEDDKLRRILVRVISQKMREQPNAEVHETVQEGVDEALSQLPPLSNTPWFEQGRPALWGDFSLVPIPEVFQLLTLQAQTGLFQVWTDIPISSSRGNARFDVYLANGRIDFVHAVNMVEDFWLGRFLVARGAIDKAELDSLLRARKGRGGKLLGQQLVALGHITREQLTQALRDQCCELIFELLRFPRGTFCLRKGTVAQGEMGEARLGITVDEILLEGLRRVDEWGMIEKQIAHFDVSFELDRRDGAQRLTEEERFVLSQVAPEMTVRQIIARTGMRPFDVCKLLYRLVVARQIRAAAG